MQTHLMNIAGPKDVIPSKTLYCYFQKSHIIGATLYLANLIDTDFINPNEYQDGLTLTTPMAKKQSKAVFPKENKSADNSSESSRLT